MTEKEGWSNVASSIRHVEADATRPPAEEVNVIMELACVPIVTSYGGHASERVAAVPTLKVTKDVVTLVEIM